jgi:hypothetical protein
VQTPPALPLQAIVTAEFSAAILALEDNHHSNSIVSASCGKLIERARLSIQSTIARPAAKSGGQARDRETEVAESMASAPSELMELIGAIGVACARLYSRHS